MYIIYGKHVRVETVDPTWGVTPLGRDRHWTAAPLKIKQNKILI